MFSRSESRLGPVGFHPSFLRVIALEAGMPWIANNAHSPKVCWSLFRGYGYCRYIQASTDGFSECPLMNAFFAHGMIPRGRLMSFQREPVETSDVHRNHFFL